MHDDTNLTQVPTKYLCTMEDVMVAVVVVVVVNEWEEIERSQHVNDWIWKVTKISTNCAPKSNTKKDMCHNESRLHTQSIDTTLGSIVDTL